MKKTFYIRTFGCAQNISDSERLASQFISQGMENASDVKDADVVIINTCMVRQMAEDRVYGLVNNLFKLKERKRNLKIVVTGCMTGMALRDKSGKFFKTIRKKLHKVDRFMPIEEIGFSYGSLRKDKIHALIPISNGCNNFCTYCVVPFARGREISRPYDDIIDECTKLAKKGYKKLTLLGMNVNSYGTDLVLGTNNIQRMRDINKTYFQDEKHKENFSRNKSLPLHPSNIKPVYVKHLGRRRIPTLFPYLLEDVAKIRGIELIDFMSSNPWDFSDELISVIASHSNISRNIHLPVQSGSNHVLQRMNRWYTREEYIALVSKLRMRIPDATLSTDIIVGFCQETEEEFQETVDLVKKINFSKAYISMYSDRPLTAAHKIYKDDVALPEKKKRWKILENLINKPYLYKHK